jgi:hypothetical protein
VQAQIEDCQQWPALGPGTGGGSAHGLLVVGLVPWCHCCTLSMCNMLGVMWHTSASAAVAACKLKVWQRVQWSAMLHEATAGCMVSQQTLSRVASGHQRY